jgi:hypothetical protein
MAIGQANILKWRTTSIFLKMEDDLNFLGNGRRPQFYRHLFYLICFVKISYLKMEEDLKLFGNGRRTQFLYKWKTTSFF